MYDLFFIGSKGHDFNNLKELYPYAQAVETVDEARSKAKTQMLWLLWEGPVFDLNFDFNFVPEDLGRIYVWPNNNDLTPTSLALVPKSRKISKRELDYRYFVNSINTGKTATYTKGYDIVFISNNEPYADDRYSVLLTHPGRISNRVLRVNGIQGIHNAHIEAAKIASTNMLWIIDADAEVLPSFEFNFDRELSPNEEEMVHLWYSRNPINGLEYGYGGIKLFPREQVLRMSVNSVDMTTSISKDIKIIPTVANITRFNTDPLSTWRSSFRECAKLSSKVINKQDDSETTNRLNQWRYNTSSEEFAEYSRSGASAGEWFGTTYKDNKEMLLKINDYKWLAAEFEQHIKMFPPSSFK